MREADAIRSIKGIGEKTEKLFAKLGIRSVGDLLRYYPRDYEEYAQPVSLEAATYFVEWSQRRRAALPWSTRKCLPPKSTGKCCTP